ncbi:MAG: right-handed parallel beta-helix repeat-containing protein [Planctomycetota bacterium]|jgi:parallel beta-helix repeat protein
MTATQVIFEILYDIQSPPENSMFPSNKVTFTWDEGNCVHETQPYRLKIGYSGVGSDDRYSGDWTTDTSAYVTSLWYGKQKTYVRLETQYTDSTTDVVDYNYTSCYKSAVTAPSTSTPLSGGTVTFEWNEALGGDGLDSNPYQLLVGTTVAGSSDVCDSGWLSSTPREYEVTGIPTDGNPVYVKINTKFYDGTVSGRNYTYTAATYTKAQLNSPSSPLTTDDVTFGWSAGVGVHATEKYKLKVGTGGANTNDIYESTWLTNTTELVEDLPLDGNEMTATLITKFENDENESDYTGYETGYYPAASFIEPPNDTDIHSEVGFNWNRCSSADPGYKLLIGTTGEGSSNIYDSGWIPANQTGHGVNDLPVNTYIDVTLQTRYPDSSTVDRHRVYHVGFAKAIIISPDDSAKLGSSVDFTWEPGSNVRETEPGCYTLSVGTGEMTPSGPDDSSIYYSGFLDHETTSHQATGIPLDGDTVLVKLKTWFTDDTTDANYVEYQTVDIASMTMTSPPDNTILYNPTVTFTWNKSDDPGIQAYQLDIGHFPYPVAGYNDINSSGVRGAEADSFTFYDIPMETNYTMYARLSAKISDEWHGKNYSYPIIMRDIVVNTRTSITYTDVNSAIVAAETENGDTLIVYPGTYPGDIKFYGKAVTVRSYDPNNSAIVDDTIISGSTTYGVRFIGGEDVSSVLSGLTVSGFSRGLYCSGSSPTISNCVIKNAVYGLQCYSSGSPVLTNCTIKNNSWYGMTCSFSSAPILNNCAISNNSSCGVSSNTDSLPTLNNCTITGTTGTASKAISCSDSSATITGCTIADNAHYGIQCYSNSNPIISESVISRNKHGIYCTTSAKPDISNCQIMENTDHGLYCSGASLKAVNCTVVGNGVSGFYNDNDSGTITITNCIIWDNNNDLYSCTASYSCIKDGGGNGGGNGNIGHFPYFADPQNDDYHLLSYSPCIDAGDPASDYSNEPSGGGGRINMGAYGNTSQATLISPDTDSDGLPDNWEMCYWEDLSYGSDDDPDEDGFANLTEYLFGYDPTTTTTVSLAVWGVFVSPFPINPLNGEMLDIEYRTNMGCNITIDITESGTSNQIRQLTDTVSAGINNAVWDGNDSSGSLAENGFYDVNITASTDTENASWASGEDIYTSPATQSYVVDFNEFNPYKNVPLAIHFDMTKWGTIHLNVREPSDVPVICVVMNNDKMLEPGSHTAYWDGRRDDNGEIYDGSFEVFYDVPQGVYVGAVLVESAAPEISNLRCNSYRIIPTYSEVSAITYELSRDANVTIEITDPDGNYFKTLCDQSAQSAGSQY